MHNLFHEWKKFYFIEGVYIILLLCVLFTALKRAKTERISYVFFFFILSDFLFLLTMEVFVIIGDRSSSNFTTFSNTFISILEATAYTIYFNVILKNDRLKKILNVIYLIIVTLLLFGVLTHFSFLSKRSNHIAYILQSLELAFLSFACILFYIQIFKVYRKEPLHERPSFWIVTGLLFFALLSIPYYLIQSYLKTIKHENIRLVITLFYYLPIIINLAFLYKGLKCKQSMTI